ncbi:MAG: hypothetical protein PSY14_02180 [bacterium]|nr:hypothetical protein [bacterium]
MGVFFNKYVLSAALFLVLAAPATGFAESEYIDEEAVEAGHAAGQSWRQKWQQTHVTTEDVAKAHYDALPLDQRQAIDARLAQIKAKGGNADELGEKHGKAVNDAIAEHMPELSREHKEDVQKYSKKAKESLKQLQATQASDAYHNHQKMNDFKYHHMDEAHQAQRAYRDYARDHPGVDAAADSAKDWWAKRKAAQ